MKIVKSSEVKDFAGEYWLNIGKEYEVLEIGADKDGPHFRVEAENGTPIIAQGNSVVVTDGSIPPSWAGRLNSSNYLAIAPRSWLKEGFWDRFFDGSKSAIKIYRIERDKIIRASGVTPETKVCECRGCASGTHVDRHGPCVARKTDAPYLWERIRPSEDRELLLCPSCIKRPNRLQTKASAEVRK